MVPSVASTLADDGDGSGDDDEVQVLWLYRGLDCPSMPSRMVHSPCRVERGGACMTDPGNLKEVWYYKY